MGIQLTDQNRFEIVSHGEAEYPRECCGFLIGQLRGTETTVTKTLRASNTRTDHAHNRFEIDPLELMRVDRTERAVGKTVVGFYHSHPDVAAMPSEYDRERAWPGYCYVIVSVRLGEAVDVRNWRLREDSSAFEEDLITFQTA